MIRKKVILMILTALIAVCMSSTVLAGTWLKDSRGWWYSNDDHSFKRNEWFMDANGKWYYFNASGYMSANEWIGNYYLGSDGAMLTNTITPDGYRVGSDGIRNNGEQGGNSGKGRFFELYEPTIRDYYENKPRYFYGSTEDWHNKMRYALTDLANDGTPELIIASVDSDGTYYVYAMRGIVNGNVQKILDDYYGWPRDVISVCEGNIISYYAFEGVCHGGTTYFVLLPDSVELKAIHECFSRYDRCYVTDGDGSNSREITQNEFERDQDGHLPLSGIQWKQYSE